MRACSQLISSFATIARRERDRSSVTLRWSTGAALALALAWAYWPTITSLIAQWDRSPDYSHGFLVPVFAAWLLWVRRSLLTSDAPAHSGTSLGLGVVSLVASIVMRLAGARYHIDALDGLSLVALSVGLALLLGGWRAFRWSWPAALFLMFMIPLPYSLEIALQSPLRRIGTIASTYALQTLGLPAFSQGNVILVNNARIGVVEACSGLRMLMIFFALATAVATVSARPWWQRLFIIASAVPIALVTNVTRITVTGFMYGMDFKDLAELVFHDLAGWLMMPMALGLLWAELWYLTHLIVTEEQQPLALGLAGREQEGRVFSTARA